MHNCARDLTTFVYRVLFSGGGGGGGGKLLPQELFLPSQKSLYAIIYAGCSS